MPSPAFAKLNDNQRAMLTTTVSDLKLLTRIGIAHIRGDANAFDEHAMAKLANPSKTRTLAKDQRGWLQFQSTMDRLATLLRAADREGSNSLLKRTALKHARPADNMVEALNNSIVDVAGFSAYAAAYDVLEHARSVFVEAKRKLGDEAMFGERTITLTGKPRAKAAKAAEKQAIGTVTALTNMHKAGHLTTEQLGAEFIKYESDPANYKLPEVAKPVQETVILAASAAAATK